MDQQSALLLILVVASTAVMAHGQFKGSGTPAARFWEQALPGSPMPEVIADLIQKGIDRSPLVEHYSFANPSISMCTLFNTICNTETVADAGLFFHETSLHPGSTMTLSFPAEAADTPPFLPHDVASKVPFDQNPTDDVLAAFHVTPGSSEAAQAEDTLRKCREPPLAGEAKACTTSLESTVQTAMDMLIGSTSIQQSRSGGGEVWAATSVLPNDGMVPRGEYVVRAVTALDGSRYVSCHRVPFPYAVYQCHGTDRAYGAYMVELAGRHGRGEDEGSTTAVSLLAFCHFDTSCWNPMHPAFQILNTYPGGSTPVCHFMSYGNLAFVKKAGGTA